MHTGQTSFKTSSTQIFLDEEGILWIRPDDDVEIDEREVESCFEIYRTLGVGANAKVLQIVDAPQSLHMTKEARDYAAKYGNDYFLASALITNNLSVRIIGNFFALFYSGRKVPFRLFGDVESAKKWLEQYRD
ncbi:MAG: hypothetical protein K0Q95_684 [Bacteroidota bacterium]|jgi:hypothetical protein|nr:hypothetical protein [Bacteroidota bacterium]